MTVADCFVSVVAPLRDDAAIVPAFLEETMAVLRDTYANYELVLVDDGSTDDTSGVVRRLLPEYECVRLIRLSRHFGEETAIAAGLDTVIGDFVAVLLPNTDPPRLIPEMVARSRAGVGVVFGVRTNRGGESLAVRLGARLWYWYSRHFLDLNLPENSSQMRVLSRQAVNAVVQIRDKYRYLRILSADVGYAHAGLPYEPILRDPAKPSRSFLERVSVTVDIIIANSQHPLRLVTVIGLVASGLNMLYMVYIVLIYFSRDDVAPGWTTLSMQSAVMFLLVFMVLSVMSEYLGHILVESRQRPLYHVLDEHNSPTVIADRERRNVVLESRGG